VDILRARNSAPGPAALQWARSRQLQPALLLFSRGKLAQGRATTLDGQHGTRLWQREHMRPLRSAAGFVVVALPRCELLLHQLGHHQRGIQMLVLDDRRLVHLPDLVDRRAKGTRLAG